MIFSDRGLEADSWKNNTDYRWAGGALWADKQGQATEPRVNLRPLEGGKSGGQRQNINNKDGFIDQWLKYAFFGKYVEKSLLYKFT